MSGVSFHQSELSKSWAMTVPSVNRSVCSIPFGTWLTRGVSVCASTGAQVTEITHAMSARTTKHSDFMVFPLISFILCRALDRPSVTYAQKSGNPRLVRIAARGLVSRRTLKLESEAGAPRRRYSAREGVRSAILGG